MHMKKNTFLTLFSLLSISIASSQSLTFKPRPTEFEFQEIRKDSLFQMKSVSLNQRVNFESKLPYPIIFIHGLNSSSSTWDASTAYFDSQYGMTFGGRFDFCLNADGNHGTANLNIYPTAGADIAAFETTMIPGDYYTVNFNVNVDGSLGNGALSNQSAIYKQGIAVKKAVERVMQLTGKNKVILVGHSMGGLASRQYIQNTNYWQPDNAHHVAKLLTLGTPHGGSNASDTGLGWFAGIDTKSEAIRDLKISYYYSGDAGRFLYGGIEVNNSSNMNEHLFGADFYNYDVNCSGNIGDNVVGLNSKPLDNLIDFSSVIGRITGGTTDGVVAEPQSIMDTYFTTLTYPTKFFYYNSTFDFIENHTELPGYYYQIMQGLDEPNFKELAYVVNTNKIYNGFTTVQSNTSDADQDFYKFTISGGVMNAAVDISSINTSVMNASVLDSSGNIVGTVVANSGSTISFVRTLTPGDYFLKIVSTTPTNTNYQTPYNFVINTTLGTSDFDLDKVAFYPNPVKDILHLDTISVSKATVYSLLGQQLEVMEFNSASKEIDMSKYAKGIYLITLESENSSNTIKVIKD
ncbi:Por secretion system C-terminal sorting domain-containing protein [Flavobacterium urocaniciphilum]|uniref:Por secretion system C-terminal sorting domain-containing protein n=2 Tax=Flavobacterium urocaniciphilum TaxID=1299341 RepID=A0A1H8YVU0_9FLAO|nr:Por secretion system C-terminal sorting domain-containing protein [Flavobacterium urocaniciphilum]